MKTFYFTVLSLVTLWGCQHSEQLENVTFMFKGVKLGATKRDVMRSIPGFGDSRTEANCLIYNGGGELYGEHADRFRFCFVNNRLSFAQANFHTVYRQTYSNAYSLLEKKYGSPTKSDNSSALWESPSAKLSISYDSLVNYMGSTLLIKDTTFLSKLNR
jgi:hypothetical protein